MFYSLLLLASLVFSSPSPPVTPQTLPFFSGTDFERDLLDGDPIVGLLVLAPPEQCGEMCDKVEAAVAEAMSKTPGPLLVGKALFHQQFTIPHLAGGDIVEPKAIGDLLGLRQETESGEVAYALPAMAFFNYGLKTTSSPLIVPSQLLVQSVENKGILTSVLSQVVPSLVESLKTSSISSFLKSSPTSRHVILVPKASRAGKAPGISTRMLSLSVFPRATFGTINPSHTAVLDEFEGALEGPFPALYVSQDGPDTAELLAAGPTHKASPKSWKWVRYTGKMDYDAMVEWLDQQLGRQTPITHVRSQRQFDERCVARGGVCILALTSDGRAGRDQLEAIEIVSNRALLKPEPVSELTSQRALPSLSKLPVSILALDGAKQPQLTSAFGVSLPAVVALNPRTKLLAVHKGAFRPEDIRQFVLDVVDGKAEMRDLPAIPSIATVEPPKPKKKKKKTKKTKKSTKKKKKTKTKKSTEEGEEL